MSVILNALRNRDLREQKSHEQVLDDWSASQMSPVISEHEDAVSLGPQSFNIQSWTTLYLVLARRVRTDNCRNDLEQRVMIEEAFKSIHVDVYGELIHELGKVIYHMHYSGKEESIRKLQDVINKWSFTDKSSID